MVYFMIRFTEQDGEIILEADALKREDATEREIKAEGNVEKFLSDALRRSGNPLEVLRPRRSFIKQETLLRKILRIVLPVMGACAFMTSGTLYQHLPWYHPAILVANILGTYGITFPVFHR